MGLEWPQIIERMMLLLNAGVPCGQICAVQNCILAGREFISPESLRYSQCSAGTRHARATATGPSSGFEDQLQVS